MDVHRHRRKLTDYGALTWRDLASFHRLSGVARPTTERSGAASEPGGDARSARERVERSLRTARDPRGGDYRHRAHWRGRELVMSQRRKIPTSEEVAATLREYMRTFPGTAAKTLRLHQCKPSGDCAGCSTATQFVRYPCQIVIAARDVLHPSWSRGE